MSKRWWLLALLPFCVATALAAKGEAAPPPDPIADPLMITAGFLTHRIPAQPYGRHFDSPRDGVRTQEKTRQLDCQKDTHEQRPR
jgi:hypothetical protein